MRTKPENEWHNYHFSHEKKLGQLEIAISLNADVIKKFIEMAQDRVNRGTGIRFKFVATGAQELVTKGEGLSLSYQLYSKDPYIFPNVSEHTDRFDSPYNRVEFYIPIERILSKEEIDKLQNTNTIVQLSLLEDL